MLYILNNTLYSIECGIDHMLYIILLYGYGQSSNSGNVALLISSKVKVATPISSKVEE